MLISFYDCNKEIWILFATFTNAFFNVKAPNQTGYTIFRKLCGPTDQVIVLKIVSSEINNFIFFLGSLFF